MFQTFSWPSPSCLSIKAPWITRLFPLPKQSHGSLSIRPSYGGGGRGRSFSPSPVSLFRFHLSPFPQKRLILRLVPWCNSTPHRPSLLATTKWPITNAAFLHRQRYIWFTAFSSSTTAVQWPFVTKPASKISIWGISWKVHARVAREGDAPCGFIAHSRVPRTRCLQALRYRSLSLVS